MKRVTLMMIAMVLTTVSTIAAPVDEAMAREYASQFLSTHAGSQRAVIPGGSDMQLVLTEMSNVVVGRAVFYVYNTSSSFVVVAGDDCILQILAYGDTPLNMNNIPCGLQFLLDLYKQGIDNMYSHTGGGEVMLSAPRPNFTLEEDIPPLLTEMWGQHEPFFNDCPVVDGEHCLTGCACTSLSMVMHYWSYSILIRPLASYTTSTLGITLEALQPTSFDWDNMLDVYEEGCYNDDQAQAVAKLMRYVGQAEYMDYTPDGSGAYESSVVNAAKKFGYDQNLTFCQRSNYSDEQWHEMIMAELQAGRPIVYMGHDQDNNVGHGFNLDGYDASSGLYHFNFGWYGECNAYCALDNIAADGYGFNDRQAMAIGIQPPENVPPKIIVSPVSLTFNTVAGEAVTQTFMVKGRRLEGDLTMELADPQGAFDIDMTTIPQSLTASGQLVTVTFNPDMACEATATVTVSGGGAEAQTVTLNGTALQPLGDPSITTSEESLDFGNCYNGYNEYRSLILTGYNLTENITLSLKGSNSIDFTIASPTTITPEMAVQGTEVVVRSFPYSQTNYWGLYLVISCPEVPEIKIPITGHSIKTGAFIYASEDSLQFETSVGKPVTMNLGITVSEFDGWIASGGSGHNLIYPDVTLLPVVGEIQGDQCFSIHSTGMVHTDGRDSIIFTIKYNPMTGGTNSAQLVLSTTSLTHQAHPVVVELTGIATAVLLGDMDGDGQLTMNDVMLLSQALTDQSLMLLHAAADVNGDGVVDLSDVIDLVDLVKAIENAR